MIILLFPLTGAFSQSESANHEGPIYPSAIFRLQKADQGIWDNLFAIPYIDENGFAENFRLKNLKATNGFLNNTLSNSHSPVIPGSDICPPVIHTSFEGNPLTPFYLPPVGYYASEVSMAISNAGKIVSISNGWIRYYNQNGTLTFSDSLYHLGNSLIDVHVMYDPKKDRFVFGSQYGYTNFENAFQVLGVSVAFSKSNNPVDGWNFYFLPDTEFNDNAIGDYPQLGISDDEIFITDLRYNYGGNITHSAIVQMDKNAGYSGEPFMNAQFYKVTLSARTKGAIEVASGGSTTYGPNMFFIMGYENGNPSNKYFVLEITNTMASGQAVLKTYGPVHSNITYSGAGISYQPNGIPLNEALAPDNEAVQTVFYENGIMQFCQNSLVNGRAGIILGRIKGIPNNLSCAAKTISDPALYLQFPSIAYAGNSSSDNSAIVGIQHTGENTYPGLSAVYVNSAFDISELTTVKNGTDTINGLWGDYSGICRRYNHPGEVWFEGQYGSTVFPAINWITKLTKPSNCQGQSIVSIIPAVKIKPDVKIYPNPFSNATSISFTIDEPQNVSLKIFDGNGKTVKNLVDGWCEQGLYELQLSTMEIEAGIYFLQFVAGAYSESKEISVIK